MIKVAVPGNQGRMGSVIVDLLNKAEDLQYTYQWDAETTKPYDVLIDFTSPEGTIKHLNECLKYNAGIVIGTTGLDASQLEEIKEASKIIPVVLSANMSLGVNICFKLLAEIATIIDKRWSIDIFEVHHKDKKDAPSGTAKTMADILAKNSARQLSDIPITSEREGDTIGVHTVSFTADDETIMLSHVAASRYIFAEGALVAAKWIADKIPGLYNMQDVISK